MGNSIMEHKVPLFIVTGSSGSGKTYVINELRRVLPDFNIFDIDNLRELGISDEQQIRNVWLRIARNTAESGRKTIICGTAMPWDIEKCIDFPYFKHVYYLNLHCDAETREKRLRERNWSDEMIQQYKNFAQRLLEIADEVYTPPMPTVDTTNTDVTEVAAQIKEWVLRYCDYLEVVE
jgi:dephospho-CoA kinase